VAIGLYIFFFQSAFFSLQRLEVRGKTSVSEELIKRTIPIPWGENIWRVSKESIASEIEKSWFVKVVSVRRKLPSTLVIEICDQVPVALVRSKNGTWLLSDSGLMWPLLKGPFTKGFSSLCRIVYPEGEISWIPGKKTTDKDLRKALVLIQSLGKVRELEISESGISVLFQNFKIVFPRVGDLKSKLRELKAVLERFSSKKGKWLIDLRFNNMAIVRERGK